MTDEHEPTGPTTPADREEQGPRKRGRWLAAALVGAAAPTAVVPAAHAGTPAAAHAATPAAGQAATAPEQVVTVRRGETVGGIAARTGTSVQAIVEANGLDGRASIVEGQRLRIPLPQAVGSDDAEAGGASGTYEVRSGDTLGAIAAAHGTTVGALREANGLDARGSIRAGQVLRLAGGAAAAPARPAASATYTVRAGDTLSHIALATGTGVDELVELNGLDATGFIVEGQRLRVGGQAAPAAEEADEQEAEQATQAPTVSAAVAANRARLQDSDQPGREEMREIIRSTAVRLGVDPSLALAVGYQESGFNMRVVSHANAIGAMQVIPSSGQWASDLLGEPIDLFDARDNAKAGVAILRTLVANNPPDVAIASYYQGQASVRSRGMYDDTRRYVANVQTLQARFS
ncbi:lytic transglycosylase [Kineococcus sp. SYSU DK006]|uniref:lytic transglycosylase n=1 Tax=Kineococcus sp. SYSU DK006 TaxID=3383127 RepID=UPI003D7EF3DD